MMSKEGVGPPAGVEEEDLVNAPFPSLRGGFEEEVRAADGTATAADGATTAANGTVEDATTSDGVAVEANVVVGAWGGRDTHVTVP